MIALGLTGCEQMNLCGKEKENADGQLLTQNMGSDEI